MHSHHSTLQQHSQHLQNQSSSYQHQQMTSSHQPRSNTNDEDGIVDAGAPHAQQDQQNPQQQQTLQQDAAVHHHHAHEHHHNLTNRGHQQQNHQQPNDAGNEEEAAVAHRYDSPVNGRIQDNNENEDDDCDSSYQNQYSINGTSVVKSTPQPGHHNHRLRFKVGMPLSNNEMNLYNHQREHVVMNSPTVSRYSASHHNQAKHHSQQLGHNSSTFPHPHAGGMPAFYPMPSHQSQNVVVGVPHVSSSNGLISQHTAPLVPSSGYYQQARPGHVAPLVGGNGHHHHHNMINAQPHHHGHHGMLTGGFDVDGQVGGVHGNELYWHENAGKDQLNLSQSQHSHTPTSFKMTSSPFNNEVVHRHHKDKGDVSYSRYDPLKLEQQDSAPVVHQHPHQHSNRPLKEGSHLGVGTSGEQIPSSQQAVAEAVLINEDGREQHQSQVRAQQQQHGGAVKGGGHSERGATGAHPQQNPPPNYSSNFHQKSGSIGGQRSNNFPGEKDEDDGVRGSREEIDRDDEHSMAKDNDAAVFDTPSPGRAGHRNHQRHHAQRSQNLQHFQQQNNEQQLRMAQNDPRHRFSARNKDEQAQLLPTSPSHKNQDKQTPQKELVAARQSQLLENTVKSGGDPEVAQNGTSTKSAALPVINDQRSSGHHTNSQNQRDLTVGTPPAETTKQGTTTRRDDTNTVGGLLQSAEKTSRQTLMQGVGSQMSDDRQNSDALRASRQGTQQQPQKMQNQNTAMPSQQSQSRSSLQQHQQMLPRGSQDAHYQGTSSGHMHHQETIGSRPLIEDSRSQRYDFGGINEEQLYHEPHNQLVKESSKQKRHQQISMVQQPPASASTQKMMMTKGKVVRRSSSGGFIEEQEEEERVVYEDENEEVDGAHSPAVDKRQLRQTTPGHLRGSGGGAQQLRQASSYEEPGGGPLAMSRSDQRRIHSQQRAAVAPGGGLPLHYPRSAVQQKQQSSQKKSNMKHSDRERDQHIERHSMNSSNNNQVSPPPPGYHSGGPPQHHGGMPPHPHFYDPYYGPPPHGMMPMDSHHAAMMHAAHQGPPMRGPHQQLPMTPHFYNGPMMPGDPGPPGPYPYMGPHAMSPYPPGVGNPFHGAPPSHHLSPMPPMPSYGLYGPESQPFFGHQRGPSGPGASDMSPGGAQRRSASGKAGKQEEHFSPPPGHHPGAPPPYMYGGYPGPPGPVPYHGGYPPPPMMMAHHPHSPMHPRNHPAYGPPPPIHPSPYGHPMPPQHPGAFGNPYFEGYGMDHPGGPESGAGSMISKADERPQSESSSRHKQADSSPYAAAPARGSGQPPPSQQRRRQQQQQPADEHRRQSSRRQQHMQPQPQHPSEQQPRQQHRSGKPHRQLQHYHHASAASAAAQHHQQAEQMYQHEQHMMQQHRHPRHQEPHQVVEEDDEEEEMDEQDRFRSPPDHYHQNQMMAQQQKQRNHQPQHHQQSYAPSDNQSISNATSLNNYQQKYAPPLNHSNNSNSNRRDLKTNSKFTARMNRTLQQAQDTEQTPQHISSSAKQASTVNRKFKQSGGNLIVNDTPLLSRMLPPSLSPAPRSHAEVLTSNHKSGAVESMLTNQRSAERHYQHNLQHSNQKLSDGSSRAQANPRGRSPLQNLESSIKAEETARQEQEYKNQRQHKTHENEAKKQLSSTAFQQHQQEQLQAQQQHHQQHQHHHLLQHEIIANEADFRETPRSLFGRKASSTPGTAREETTPAAQVTSSLGTAARMKAHEDVDFEGEVSLPQLANQESEIRMLNGSPEKAPPVAGMMQQRMIRNQMTQQNQMLPLAGQSNTVTSSMKLQENPTAQLMSQTMSSHQSAEEVKIPIEIKNHDSYVPTNSSQAAPLQQKPSQSSPKRRTLDHHHLQMQQQQMEREDAAAPQ